MSYSFNIKAADKDTARSLVATEVDKVLAMFPVHALDQAAILANANSVIDLSRDLAGNEEISVSVNGYISTNIAGEPSTVSISAGASVYQKVPA